jgi:lipoprotein-releasing system ATP-binding protein
MIQSAHVQFSYDENSSFRFPDIRCEKAESLLLLGSSGKGKTTLLHILAGLLTPTAGTVTIAGEEIISMSRRSRDDFRGKHMGIIFQSAHFIASLSALDNLLMVPYLCGKGLKRNEALALMKRLGIDHHASKSPHQMSVGEQQRLAIARAISHRPEVIFADEPTSALDDANTREVIALLREEAALAGSALLIVTHDARLKAAFKQCIEL